MKQKLLLLVAISIVLFACKYDNTEMIYPGAVHNYRDSVVGTYVGSSYYNNGPAYPCTITVTSDIQDSERIWLKSLTPLFNDLHCNLDRNYSMAVYLQYHGYFYSSFDSLSFYRYDSNGGLFFKGGKTP